MSIYERYKSQNRKLAASFTKIRRASYRLALTAYGQTFYQQVTSVQKARAIAREWVTR